MNYEPLTQFTAVIQRLVTPEVLQKYGQQTAQQEPPTELQQLTESPRRAGGVSPLFPDIGTESAGELSPLFPQAEAANNESRAQQLASCCLAGLWLLYGFLDRSHRISQKIDAVEGSWWHAIMHRREGDWSNSKYWYRRVGAHPLVAELDRRCRLLAAEYPGDAGLEHMARLPMWDSFELVDVCAEATRLGNLQRPSRLQQLEWLALFEYCWQSR